MIYLLLFKNISTLLLRDALLFYKGFYELRILQRGLIEIVDTNKITQMIRIAKMHYELNRTQLEIAKKEGISKATVSRILKICYG